MEPCLVGLGQREPLRGLIRRSDGGRAAELGHCHTSECGGKSDSVVIACRQKDLICFSCAGLVILNSLGSSNPIARLVATRIIRDGGVDRSTLARDRINSQGLKSTFSEHLDESDRHRTASSRSGVAIRPPVPDVIGLLTPDHHVAVGDPEHGIRIRRQKMSQVWDGEWGSEQILVSYAGLEPKLKATLERLGHKVKMAGQRPGNLPRPQRPESGGQQPDDAVLDFIRRREQGIIRYDRPASRWRGGLPRWPRVPEQSLLVVARRQNDVRRIAARLEDCESMWASHPAQRRPGTPAGRRDHHLRRERPDPGPVPRHRGLRDLRS